MEYSLRSDLMRQQVIHIQLENGSRVALRYLPADFRSTEAAKSVLYVHGATFPSALSIGFEFDGRSWMDDLASNGFNAWALDFIGYGASDRYEDRRSGTAENKPPGRCDQAVRQIARAMGFALDHDRTDRMSIIAHSWGTIPAGRFAGDFPGIIDRLILFGPIARRDRPRDNELIPDTRLITCREQYDRFTDDVPDGEAAVLENRHFDLWAKTYLASDANSECRRPRAVSVPNGPVADIREAWSGELPYDPARIKAPTLIVRGEWDSLCDDVDARWLIDALSGAEQKQDIKIAKATHLMHLERRRHELYEASRKFLAG